MSALRAIIKFCRDERGATAIEYAMIASLLSIAIMTAMLSVSGSLGNIFNDVSDKVGGALDDSN